MGSTKRKHTHTHRVTRVGDVWKCALPDCVWFMYDRQAQNILFGRNVVCWDCGEPFPMDERAFKMERPSCIDCRDKETETLTRLREKANASQ